MKDSHNLPHATWREHDLSLDCWCHPRRDEEYPSVIIHNKITSGPAAPVPFPTNALRKDHA